MSEALLLPRVMKVLLSPSVAKMDFWAHGMHVSAGGYVMVWFYIAQGWVKLRLVRMASQIPKDAEAQYTPDNHTLWFRRDSYGSRPEERATILHECTHALRDIMAGPAFRKEGMYGSNIVNQLHFDNEAAAYIAGALFYFYDNGVKQPVGADDESDYFAAANSIIDGLINKNGARADESAFSDLSDKISLDPHYAAIASRGDPDDIGRW
jgi:hypothetical protein